MSQARYARCRPLRGFGWCVALPVAAIVCMAAGLTIHISVGLVSGAVISIVGLAILSLGYLLGDILGSYWMIPVALAGGDVALVTHVFGGSWSRVLLGTGGFILMVALIAALVRTGRGNGGMVQLVGHFFGSLIPGHYR